MTPANTDSDRTTEAPASVVSTAGFGEGVRTRVDRPWSQYPIGTKAPSIMGGRWYRTARGWKWNGPDGSGGTFPTPGGDNDGTVILPPNGPVSNAAGETPRQPLT
jgi:hypothetical protein